MTTDPNTLFRGNSIATKMIDEFMKLIGLSYLRRTMQCCIDEVCKPHIISLVTMVIYY